jgi:hypothetical protein
MLRLQFLGTEFYLYDILWDYNERSLPMPKGDVLAALIETTPLEIELPSVDLISEQRKGGRKKTPLCYWICCFLCGM